MIDTTSKCDIRKLLAFDQVHIYQRKRYPIKKIYKYNPYRRDQLINRPDMLILKKCQIFLELWNLWFPSINVQVSSQPKKNAKFHLIIDVIQVSVIFILIEKQSLLYKYRSKLETVTLSKISVAPKIWKQWYLLQTDTRFKRIFSHTDASVCVVKQSIGKYYQ